jgi:putative tricarboxylic transport membrane protein
MFKNKNVIAALFFLLISLISLGQGYRIKIGSLSAPGAGLFPFYLGLFLFLVSLFLFLKSFKARPAGKEERIMFGRRWPQLLLALAVFVGYVVALKPLGYLICSLLFLVLFFKGIEGRSWRSTLVISVICTVVSYVVFAKYLGVPLPKGVLPY